MEIEQISIAKDFSRTPGPRSPEDGKFSGEEFLEKILDPAFRRAEENQRKLLVDLDGTAGYATSFLEAAFGGLARKYPPARVLAIVQLKSLDEPFLIKEITGYIENAQS